MSNDEDTPPLIDELTVTGMSELSMSEEEIQQVVELDESLARGEHHAITASAGFAANERLAKQLRCIQLLRQSAHEQSNDSVQQLLPSLGKKFPIQLGKFEIREELGRGGYGVVFLAFDRVMGRDVALKIPNTNVLLRDELLHRFRTESRAAGALDHPNIVQVYDAGHVGPVHYIASAYCPGVSLHDWLTEANCQVDQRDAASLIMVMARAIQHANERGVLHRDLKPANVLLQASTVASKTDGGPTDQQANLRARAKACSLAELMPKITDFGLAKMTGEDHATASGAILGTPAYMAPEQASGMSTASTTRVDVYSLGAVFYQLLSNRVPFEGATPWDVLRQVMHETPVSLRALRPGIARDLETICAKCMEKPPEARYASAGHLADDLQRFLNDEPILARKASPVEQLWKLWRRKPLPVSLAATLLLAVLTGLITVSYLWTQSESRRVQVENALKDSRHANELAHQEQVRSERMLYLNRVSLAEQERTLNWSHAREELALCKPDHRNWEWNYLWKQCHPELYEVTGHKQSTRNCVFNHDGSLIASCSGTWGLPAPGEIIVRDSRSGKPLHEWHGHLGQISGLSFHPTKNWIASSDNSWQSGQQGCTNIWDCDSGQHLIKLERAISAFDVAFSPDGEELAVGGTDGKILCYRTSDWQLVRTFAGNKRSVHQLSYHPSGRFLASGGRDGKLCVFDLQSETLVFEQDDLNDVRCVSFTGDGTHLACSTFTGHWFVWTSQDWQLVARHYSVEGRVVSISPYPDGTSLIVTTVAGPTRILDAVTGEVSCTLFSQYPGTSHAVAHPKGDLIASSGFDAKLRMWSTATTLEPPNFVALQSYVGDIAPIPNSRLVAAAPTRNSSHVGRGNGDYAIRLCDRDSRTVIRQLSGHESWVTKLDVDAQGSRLVSASQDGSLRLWDIATGNCLSVLNGHDGEVRTVSYLSDRHCLSAGADGKIKLWDLNLGSCVGDLAVSETAWLALTTSGTSGCVAAADEGGSVKLWKLENPQALPPAIECLGLSGPVNCLSFSADGQQLAAGNNDYRIAFWTVSTDANRHNLPQAIEPRMICKLADREVRDIQFMDENDRLAYASTNYGHSSSLRLLDTVTGEEALNLDRKDETALAIAYDPEPRELLFAANSSVTLYSPMLSTSEQRWDKHRSAAYDWHLKQANRAFQRQRSFSEIFHLSRCIEERPTASDIARLYFRRCSALAAVGQWEHAEQDLDEHFRLAADATSVQFTKPLLKVAQEDLEGFHLACDELICVSAGSDDAGKANDLAWTLALTPHRLDDIPLAFDRIQYAMTHAKDVATQALTNNTLALVLYRMGDHEAALETALQAIKLKKGVENESDRVVLALIYGALGDRDKSLEYIAKVRNSLEQSVHLAQPPSRLYSRAWFDRFQIELVLSEARRSSADDT